MNEDLIAQEDTVQRKLKADSRLWDDQKTTLMEKFVDTRVCSVSAAYVGKTCSQALVKYCFRFAKS